MRRKADIALVLAIGALIALPFLPGNWPLAAMLQSVPPVGYLVCLALLGLLIQRRRRRALLVAGAGVAVAGLAAVGVPGHAPSAGVRIATWNTEFWDQGEGPDSFANAIRALDADILLLQEHLYWDGATGGTRAIDRADALRACCGYVHVWVQGELVIASRLKGIRRETVHPQILAVEIAGAEILNVHVPVHVTLLHAPTDARFWAYARNATTERSEVFRALRERIDDAPQRAVVGGDFNATWLMPDLRHALLSPLKAGFADLWPASFPSGGPALWRLDYLLSGDGRLRGCHVGRGYEAQSDHRPVICTLVVPS